MKQFIFLILLINTLFLSMLSVSTAQVITGDVTLSSQAEVNSFVGTSINGSLTIEGTDITDLTPLLTLVSVDSGFIIKLNDLLTNLDGLSSITSVGYYLETGENGALNSFCGLYQLLSSEDLHGSYTVEGNLINPTQQEIINAGPCIPTEVAENSTIKPDKYELKQNYPNPFNPSTMDKYGLPEQSNIKIEIFNMLGQSVGVIVDT